MKIIREMITHIEYRQGRTNIKTTGMPKEKKQIVKQKLWELPVKEIE